MIKLVVNADDYGINPSATQAITDCLRNGWITNTTLMVNMPSCESAVAQAKRFGLLDCVGLHLNFYQGKPLTERMRHCSEFCDESGVYHAKFMLGIKRAWIPLASVAREAVAEETEAQVRRYLDLGCTVRHFDAHHHAHVVGKMIRPVFEVMKRYGFKSVRRPLNVAVRTKFRSRLYYPIEGMVKQGLMRGFGFVTTDYMGGIDGFRVFCDRMKDGMSAELMVHPVYLKNGIPDLSGEMIDSWKRPMSETVDFIRRRGGQFSLVSFKDMQEA